MPWKTVTFDDSVERIGGGGLRVPEGYYLGEIVKVFPRDEKECDPDNDKWPWIGYEIRLVKGAAGLGQTIRYVGTLKPDAQFANGRIWAAAGVNVTMTNVKLPTYKHFEAVCAKLGGALTGKQVAMLIGDGQPNARGNVYSQVAEIYPAEEYEPRAKAMAGGPIGVPTRQPAAPKNGAPGALPAAAPPAPEVSDEAVENELDAMLKEAGL